MWLFPRMTAIQLPWLALISLLSMDILTPHTPLLSLSTGLSMIRLMSLRALQSSFIKESLTQRLWNQCKMYSQLTLQSKLINTMTSPSSLMFKCSNIRLLPISSMEELLHKRIMISRSKAKALLRSRALTLTTTNKALTSCQWRLMVISWTYSETDTTPS